MITQKTIAILTGRPQFDEKVVEALDPTRFQAISCSTADELYQQSMHGRIDALIIRHELPGFFSGLQITERLVKDLIHPVTVLIGDLSGDELATAKKLGLSVLEGSATGDAVAAAATGRLLTAIHTKICIPHQARALVRDADFIRPLPQLIVRLARFLDDPNAPIQAVAAEIAVDSRTTAELLRMINSAAMGVASKISRIDDAVKLLGIKRTISMVVASYVLTTSRRGGLSLPLELDHELRRRSVLEAAAAKSFAQMKGHRSPDMAYITGLLQDIGIGVLVHGMGGNYSRILERCRRLALLNLPAYEKRELGFTHADVSSALLQKWELPPSLIQLVLDHHTDVDSTAISGSDLDLIAAMQFGEGVADLKENPAPQRIAAFRKGVRHLVNWDEAKVRECVSRSIALACEASEVFSVPVPDPAALKGLVTDLATCVGLQMHDDDAPQDHMDAGTPGTGPLILVLGREFALLRSIEEMLVDAGYSVQIGMKIEELEARFTQADALIVDLQIGGTGGIALAERLRADGLPAPIIIMAGDLTRSTVMRSISAGVNDFLPKPFTRSDLLSKLTRHVRQAVTG